jgi:DNA invertase Pin-like site-specific DNA recombinase
MTSTDTQRRAGCYLRISSDKKDKREGVDRQKDDTTDQCEIYGWTPVGYYTDNDRSASSGKARPEWDRLLGDVKAGKIDAIVVWNQDRGWRMMAELETLRPQLEPYGVLLATTNIGVIDFRNADDVFRAQISTAMSEMEIAKMKIRMRRAARQKAERGIPQWTRAFGYKTDGSREPDPFTAPLVVKAYAMILRGETLNGIGKFWNEAGALTLNGKLWTEPQVSNFLRKARNAGLRSHTTEINGEKRTEIVGSGNWAALVDVDTWKAAQAVLENPSRKPGRKSVSRHPFTGVMQCGRPGCDGYLRGNWVMQPTGGKSGRPKAGESPVPSGEVRHSITYSCRKCHRVSVHARHIEPLLFELVGRRLAMPKSAHLLKADVDPAQAERIRLELETLYARRRAIGIDRAKGLLDGEQAKAGTDYLNAEIAELESGLQDEERVRVFADIPVGEPEAVEAVRTLSPDRFRAVLAVMGTVYVMPVGKGGKVFDRDRVQVVWHDDSDQAAA